MHHFPHIYMTLNIFYAYVFLTGNVFDWVQSCTPVIILENGVHSRGCYIFIITLGLVPYSEGFFLAYSHF